jgi:hypothetical protein
VDGLFLGPGLRKGVAEHPLDVALGGLGDVD